MHPRTLRALDEWLRAGLIDSAVAERIRAFEARPSAAHGTPWPALLAWIFGGVLLGAGVLLFVAAHWDGLSPASRFLVVLLAVASSHVAAGAAGARFPALGSVLHAVGTVALGAGVFMAGQIFHLEEHWPGGLLLWAAGAWAAYLVLRDWPQAALAAVLTPAWLAGEWIVATEWTQGGRSLLGQALVLLAATYLAARATDRDAPLRRALAWTGGLALIPCVVVALEPWRGWHDELPALPVGLALAGWIVGLAGPLALALRLRGRAAWIHAVAAVWAVGLTQIAGSGAASRELGLHAWCLLGSIALVAWGVGESRPERINLGIAGFAITVVAFYFSSVIDKLGRATSLIGLGLLFLLGGWILERARRRLLARVKERSA